MLDDSFLLHFKKGNKMNFRDSLNLESQITFYFSMLKYTAITSFNYFLYH